MQIRVPAGGLKPLTKEQLTTMIAELLKSNGVAISDERIDEAVQIVKMDKFERRDFDRKQHRVDKRAQYDARVLRASIENEKRARLIESIDDTDTRPLSARKRPDRPRVPKGVFHHSLIIESPWTETSFPTGLRCSVRTAGLSMF